HHTWSNQPSALFTLWRSKACNGFLRIVFIVFPWSRAIRAPVFKQAAMKMRHIARASSLVQVVNVLGGDVNVFDGITPLPVGNSLMPRVGFCPSCHPGAPAIPRPHWLWIFAPCIDTC